MSKLVVTDEQRAIGEEIIGRYFVELGVHKQKDIQDSIATAIAKAVEEEMVACANFVLEYPKSTEGYDVALSKAIRQRGKRKECQDCLGEGFTEEDCKECEGTGKIESDCNKCDGTGEKE